MHIDTNHLGCYDCVVNNSVFCETNWEPAEHSAQFISELPTHPSTERCEQQMASFALSSALRGLAENRIEPVRMANNTRLDLHDFVDSSVLILDSERLIRGRKEIATYIPPSELILTAFIMNSQSGLCYRLDKDTKGRPVKVTTPLSLELNDPEKDQHYVRTVGLYAISRTQDGKLCEQGLSTAVISDEGSKIGLQPHAGGSYTCFPSIVGQAYQHPDGMTRLRRALIIPLPRMSDTRPPKPRKRPRYLGLGALLPILR